MPEWDIKLGKLVPPVSLYPVLVEDSIRFVHVKHRPAGDGDDPFFSIG